MLFTNKINFLEPLLKLGANEQMVCVDGESWHWVSKAPLCIASDTKSLQAIQLLIQYGANPLQLIEQAGSEPTTPLLRATLSSSLDVVHELVKGWLISRRNAAYSA